MYDANSTGILLILYKIMFLVVTLVKFRHCIRFDSTLPYKNICRVILRIFSFDNARQRVTKLEALVGSEE